MYHLKVKLQKGGGKKKNHHKQEPTLNLWEKPFNSPVLHLMDRIHTTAAMPILKIDFKIKAVKRDKEEHYIIIKGSIQQEDITIINIYASNIGAPQYVREMLTSMKGEINNNTIIVWDFNTPLTPMDRSTKQKINKETNFK